MEVGIEDCLHIEFEYDKAKYHLRVRRGGAGWVLGRIAAGLKAKMPAGDGGGRRVSGSHVGSGMSSRGVAAYLLFTIGIRLLVLPAAMTTNRVSIPAS